MAESHQAKELAKKKVTKVANPVEAYGKPAESGVESSEALVAKDGVQGSVLAKGYFPIEADLDMFDNERNYTRVCDDEGSDADTMNGETAYNKPAKEFGPKKKKLDPEGEDYGS